MRGSYLLLGALLALAAVYLYRQPHKGAVTTPTLATRIELNPALYSYPGVSSIGAAYA